MRVMVMVKATSQSEAGKMPSTELLAAMGNFNEELVKAGVLLAGEELHPSARGKRVHFSGSQRTVIDGPFTRLVLEWAQAPSVQPAEWVRRLCFVRGFARCRSATDVLTEVPPLGLLPYRSTRAKPYLYTEEEVQRLLDAALQLPTAWPSTPLRPWVFHCLLGLLSVTGPRISEALNLKLGDIDLEQAILTIRAAKLGRSRLVPIHPSTCAVLTEYLQRREQFFGGPISMFVFVNHCGNRLDGGHVHRTFYALSRRAGLRTPGASKGPRLHDFRHRFALQVLKRWYQSGEDPVRRLPVLSTVISFF